MPSTENDVILWRRANDKIDGMDGEGPPLRRGGETRGLGGKGDDVISGGWERTSLTEGMQRRANGLYFYYLD